MFEKSKKPVRATPKPAKQEDELSAAQLDKRLRMLKSVYGERKGQNRYDAGFTN